MLVHYNVGTVFKTNAYLLLVDELFISYLAPDNTTCIEVYEDLTLQTLTMSWCSMKYDTAPGWSGITADIRSGYLAHNILKNTESVIDVYKCDFGCGNGVVSAIRNEQCETSGSNCTSSCTCAPGSNPRSPPGLSCIGTFI